MSESDRLDRLEARLAALETIVRQVVSARGEAMAAPPPAAPRDEALVMAVPAEAPPGAAAAAPAEPADRPVIRPRPVSAEMLAEPPGREAGGGPARPRGVDLEEWLGQRGLLAVGVVALILAAGYLLKLSFERGWITPLMRCVGGVVVGGALGVLGHRLLPRLRTYGAALIGCGAGIMYLAVWAAARLYEFLPPVSGVLALALISASLAMIAAGIGVQALGATAAVGAMAAPLLSDKPWQFGSLLLIYGATAAAGLGVVAARLRWRLAALLLAAGAVLLGLVAGDRGGKVAVMAYGVAIGGAGLYLGLRERWWETRFVGFWGGWILLFAGGYRVEQRPLLLAGALLLAAPVWYFALRREGGLPFARGSLTGGWPLGEWLSFYTTPLLLALAVSRQAIPSEDRGTVTALGVGLLYLLPGLRASGGPFALVSAAGLGIAAVEHWDGELGTALALLVLAAAWGVFALRTRREEARWFAALTWVAGALALVGEPVLRRPAEAPSFLDAWAGGLWLAVLSGAALARWEGADDRATDLRRGALWTLTGIALLGGVSWELRRLFAQRAPDGDVAFLAAGLAISAWWLVFAAVLVLAGFRRQLAVLRRAGLAVAGLALFKVVAVDLSELDALYRVGSVFLLGAVSLALAYVYNRQARAARAASGPESS